ncbi:inosine-uridine nucleoside N-ribohydrolase [Kineococcus xinjiangensis]|uniref:Inosine-uridine nucleoside N-ribohydrolase n=1 Tax=Kineococcus xinjiangensis TaxID=512762 RepID=A0A2S6IDJ0_9ACTN|nr:nucleoside hydrolase [Kineococcus xinjiangensis]PPK92285.1 inosine-uridine nucleoside N-ribohydrolase [Kineococcus xinjiangensis]
MSGDPWIEAARQAEELRAASERLGMPSQVAQVPPALPLDSPLILDTDVGGDPDDAVAVVAAAQDPLLALVVTADETPEGERARLARLLLDQLGRADVGVVRGPCLGATRYVALDGLVLPPADLPAGEDAVEAAVGAVVRAGGGRARWVGMGPLTSLAALQRRRPDLVGALRVTQMGAALDYRHPDRAEHNVRLDVAAARHVLAHVADLEFVLSDVTFTPELALGADHPITTALADSALPWAQTLTAHLRAWFDRFHPDTLQHDALTLTAALGLPVVSMRPATVALDEIGRMREAEGGRRVRLSQHAHYGRFWFWLHQQFTAAGLPLPRPAATTS